MIKPQKNLFWKRTPTMSCYRSAVFGFLGLLAILVAGSGKTYFSVLFQGLDKTHHFHGIVMLLWVLLLINQAWLVRSRRFDIHRITGKISYVLAPLVVISGIVVTLFNPGRLAAPAASQSGVPSGCSCHCCSVCSTGSPCTTESARIPTPAT